MLLYAYSFLGTPGILSTRTCKAAGINSSNIVAVYRPLTPNSRSYSQITLHIRVRWSPYAPVNCHGDSFPAGPVQVQRTLPPPLPYDGFYPKADSVPSRKKDANLLQGPSTGRSVHKDLRPSEEGRRAYNEVQTFGA